MELTVLLRHISYSVRQLCLRVVSSVSPAKVTQSTLSYRKISKPTAAVWPHMSYIEQWLTEGI